MKKRFLLIFGVLLSLCPRVQANICDRSPEAIEAIRRGILMSGPVKGSIRLGIIRMKRGPDCENINERDLARVRILNLYNRAEELYPNDFDGLVNAEVINIAGNDLEGPIPDGLRNLTNLRVLALQDNDFTGPIPEWLGDFPHLRVLSLYNNDFERPIPESLRHLIDSDDLYKHREVRQPWPIRPSTERPRPTLW